MEEPALLLPDDIRLFEGQRGLLSGSPVPFLDIEDEEDDEEDEDDDEE